MTKEELEDLIETLADGIDECLDPALSREEVVAKLQELSDIASGEVPALLPPVAKPILNDQEATEKRMTAFCNNTDTNVNALFAKVAALEELVRTLRNS